jgi:hypothetical protein
MLRKRKLDEIELQHKMISVHHQENHETTPGKIEKKSLFSTVSAHPCPQSKGANDFHQPVDKHKKEFQSQQHFDCLLSNQDWS